MGNGSCFLTLKLHFILRRTASLRPPAHRILLCFHGYRPAWTTPTWGTQFAKLKSFFTYRLRYQYDPTAFDFVHTVERSYSTLAHSSNFRSLTDCVRSILSNRKSKASLGFAVGSCRNTAFLSLCHNYRSPPDSIFVYYEQARPYPLEPVTSACRVNQPEGRPRNRSRLQQGLGTPDHPNHLPRPKSGLYPEA